MGRKRKKPAPRRRGLGPDLQSLAAGIPEYYHAPFQAIGHGRHADIDSAYLSAPIQLRKAFFESERALGRVFSGAEAHTLLRGLADRIEQGIANSLGLHSVFFWMHLYRRIGVGLHAQVESKTDSNTIALVRLIVEAAIQKHGNSAQSSDVGLTGSTPWNRVLGGQFEQAWMQVLGAQGYEKYLHLLAGNQWVLVSFDPSDLVAMYGVEGLAYQYWRCTAAMRAVSKGSRLVVGPDGQMQHVETPSLYALIDSYDRRIQRPSILYSNAGLIAHVSASEVHAPHMILNCEYNIERKTWRKLYHDASPLPSEFIPNFIIQPLHAKAFLTGHGVLAEPFQKKTGIPLHHVVALLSAVGVMALSKLTRRKMPHWRVVHELTKRAYSVLNYSPEALRGELEAIAIECCKALQISSDQIAASVDAFLHKFTSTSTSQQQISLWTYGPRPIFIHYGQGVILDISGLSRVLLNLFVGVRDAFGKKGFEFEKAATAYLVDRGFRVLPDRRLRLASGEERETDIAIRIGHTLVLCDCRSIERPLDIEIGVPGKLEKRQEFLASKLAAVASMERYVAAHPKGENFDFSWAAEVLSVGVTPFVEWISSDEDEWWIDKAEDVPKIMALSELDQWLEKLTAGTAGNDQLPISA